MEQHRFDLEHAAHELGHNSRLLAYLNQLEERVAALEAELVPHYRNRKCPRCHTI